VWRKTRSHSVLGRVSTRGGKASIRGCVCMCVCVYGSAWRRACLYAPWVRTREMRGNLRTSRDVGVMSHLRHKSIINRCTNELIARYRYNHSKFEFPQRHQVALYHTPRPVWVLEYGDSAVATQSSHSTRSLCGNCIAVLALPRQECRLRLARLHDCDDITGYMTYI